MTKLFLIAATMLSAATSPVVAREARPAGGSAATASEATVAHATAPSKQRYCIISTTTGSRIPVKTCKTRSEWMNEEDFDPLAAK